MVELNVYFRNNLVDFFCFTSQTLVDLSDYLGYKKLNFYILENEYNINYSKDSKKLIKLEKLDIKIEKLRLYKIYCCLEDEYYIFKDNKVYFKKC